MRENTFKVVDNRANISEEGIMKKNETQRQHMYKLEANEDNTDVCNACF